MTPTKYSSPKITQKFLTNVFQSITRKLLNGTIIFEKPLIKKRVCQRYRAEKSNNVPKIYIDF